ncbi:MAG: ubiquinol-cytochrome C chaperone family protein [Pseudomonadota bacterium]
METQPLTPGSPTRSRADDATTDQDAVPMFGFLKSRNPHAAGATRLYGSVVTQARDPAFYTLAGVPDTMEGRFEMIVLHLSAVIDRLRAETASDDPFATQLVATFVTDIDDSYREIGLSDTRVPKKVKKAAAVLYDRTLQYRALTNPDGDATPDDLRAALAENVFPDGAGDAGADEASVTDVAESADRLARYVVALRRDLAASTADVVREANVRWPDAHETLIA